MVGGRRAAVPPHCVFLRGLKGTSARLILKIPSLRPIFGSRSWPEAGTTAPGRASSGRGTAQASSWDQPHLSLGSPASFPGTTGIFSWDHWHLSLGSPPARCQQMRSSPALPTQGLHLHHAQTVSFHNSLALPRRHTHFPLLIPSFRSSGFDIFHLRLFTGGQIRGTGHRRFPLAAGTERRSRIPHCRYH